MDTHFPGSSENHTVEYIQHSGVEIDFIPVDKVWASYVYWAIRSFKQFKSPGPDSLLPVQLQQSQNYIIIWLETILKGNAFKHIQPRAILSAFKDLDIFEPMCRSVQKGTSQGGVLSLLLWILTINKLLLGPEKDGLHIAAYALWT